MAKRAPRALWPDAVERVETRHEPRPKSNSFINILQSFIHGYAIIYFFHVTLSSVIIPCCHDDNNDKQTINKGEARRVSVYTTLSGAEGQLHIWAPGLTPDPLHMSKNKKKGKQKRLKSSCVSGAVRLRAGL